MKSILLLSCLAPFCFDLVSARPLSARKSSSSSQSTSTSSKSTASTAKLSKATDGSTIIDDSVVINGLTMRYKVSAPTSAIVGNGNTQGNGTLGINVLFHGDGGQSFVDFPNQGVNSGLMGVALLAPDADLRWGGSDPNDNTGLVRPQGASHSAAVNQLLTKVLPTVVNFDSSKVFLEGVSGGSLLLSGFMIPTFGSSLAVQGAVLGCGGLTPQVKVQGNLTNLRLHFQSTTDDLAPLKTSIPQSIKAYEQLIPGSVGNVSLVTADASPVGGHCEFDQKAFVSGVQLLTDNYASILNGRSAVAHSVLGNEDIYDPAQVKAAAAKNAAAAAQSSSTSSSKSTSSSSSKSSSSSSSSNNSSNNSSASKSKSSNNNSGNNNNNNQETTTVVKVVKTVEIEETKTVKATKTVQEVATVTEFTTTIAAGSALVSQTAGVSTVTQFTTTITLVPEAQATMGSNNNSGKNNNNNNAGSSNNNNSGSKSTSSSSSSKNGNNSGSGKGTADTTTTTIRIFNN